MNHCADIIVVGAGVIGLWTALSLRERGADVLLIDAYGVGNRLASSGGESRNIRAAYGEQQIYTRWAMQSWQLWQAREAELGLQLVYPCGSLRQLDAPRLAAQTAIFDRLGHRYEAFDGDEVSRRWPQIALPGDHILYEPQSGILAAQTALIALAALFEAKGGRIITGRVAPPAGDLLVVDGDVLRAGQFVFACGPWLPRLFPDLLADRIVTPRRELFFLAPDAEDTRFDWQHCPNLVSPLGWTSANIGNGVKIAPILRGIPYDPDTGDRTPTAALLDQVQGFVTAHLPGLAGRAVVGSLVSQLENTDNAHFILDWHPQHRNIFIAGGGSGHAYKMGPVIGAHVADQLLGAPADPDLAALFGLAAHGPVPPGVGD